jgi:multicomponent Na+:H+ antiporter subunit G
VCRGGNLSLWTDADWGDLHLHRSVRGLAPADLFMRMHANTKSATLGVGFIILGAAIYFSDVTITTRAVAVILFLLVTAPISSHLLARAAYFSGIPLWNKTLSDDLRGHYDPNTHQLSGEEGGSKLPFGGHSKVF